MLKVTLLFFVGIAILFCVDKCYTRNLYLVSNFNLHLTQDTSENDLQFDFNEIQTTGDNLLPEKMSFMERFLWSNDGFLRKIGLASPLTFETRQKELKFRRNLITFHQTLGLITWGLMVSSAIAGQLWLDGKMDSPELHRVLVRFTIGSYALTGISSIIAPPPIIRRDEFSTISVHKTLAWLHFAGMVATPILGKLTRESSDYYKSARTHQTFAYVTTGIYTIAMLTILLFE